MSDYFDQLCLAMSTLAQNPRTLFLGQGVYYPGTAMYRTLEHLDPIRRLELPVAEDMQLGVCTGMSLNGHIPIAIYPRWNFVLLAMSQLVLHLDKLPLYSNYRPKVIIRTAVATPDPLDPGPQHLGDYTDAVDQMLDTVCVVKLHSADQVVPKYQAALERDTSTILVEYSQAY